MFARLLALTALTVAAVVGLTIIPAHAETDSDWTRSAFRLDDDRPQRRGARSARSAASSGSAVTFSGGGQTGVASYYWQPQAVASGGRFNPNALTAAHKTLPFGTRVRVTHLSSGRTVDVTINDRGPFIAGRIIDLSRRAAQQIGMTGQGVARVSVQVL